MQDVRCDNGTKVGRDGKGQFNMYDPDGIRAELMSFHAVEKPCCSRVHGGRSGGMRTTMDAQIVRLF